MTRYSRLMRIDPQLRLMHSTLPACAVLAAWFSGLAETTHKLADLLAAVPANDGSRNEGATDYLCGCSRVKRMHA